MRRRAALLLLLAACTRDQAASDATRPIEMLVPTDAETLDPRYATDAVALRTTRLLHAGLVRLDPSTLEPRPYLARSWEWDEGRLRVRLREARFHSGAPFGARDVAATIAAFQSPAVGSRHARVVEPIDRVTIEDERTVLVSLKHPHATLLTDLEIPILRADEAAGPPRGDGSLDGLGPFMVARREEGAIVLAPAKDGALPAPAHGVTIRTVHDENARALRMHAGRADLVVNGFSPTLLPSFTKTRGIDVVARPGANLTYLLVNHESGLGANEKVRRALAAGIDRARIAATLFAGHATAASTLLPPTHWAHTPAAAIAFDRDGVRAELGAAGVPLPLRLTLLTSTDRLRNTIARQLAQDFAPLGIELEVVPLELGTMLARLNAGDFELAMLQMPEVTEPNVLRFFLHSSNVPPAGANRGRVRDPAIDRLLDQAAAKNDPTERRALYADLERTIAARASLIPLWHEDQIAVTSARAAGFQPSAEGRWLDLARLP
ncbi:MAG: ABC transporter substrate-binding protein [Labilithrix sp.]|nr:ABC transporter substrate-binding protein [Labilithrix sp.]MCW5815115.1 ABC transporter substrate-binding protein [Labilithrix sp.]